MSRARNTWDSAATLCAQFLLVFGFRNMDQHDLPIVLMLMQLTVVVLALSSGMRWAIAGSISASALVNWFLIPPVDTFHVADRQSLAALVVFTLVGVTISILVSRVRKAEAATRSLSQSTDRLSDELDQLQQETDDLRDRDNARRWLLASASHELRTPLSTIRIVMESQVDRNDELTRAGLASIERLDSLVENLLDVSRIDAGVLVSSEVLVSVDEIIEDAVTGLDSARIDVDIDPDLPLVRTDPVLSARVISNLAANALKHSPMLRRVTIRAAATQGIVSIKVVDQGSGNADIVRAAMRGIRHLQTSDRPSSSTGLGLVIVRELSRHLGMSFDVVDTPGGGVTAVVAWSGHEHSAR